MTPDSQGFRGDGKINENKLQTDQQRVDSQLFCFLIHLPFPLQLLCIMSLKHLKQW